MLSETYQVTGPEIVFEEFDGDLVVLNLTSGQYFGMNAIGAQIWSVVVKGTPSSEIAAAYTDPKAAGLFLQKLVELGLIVPCDTTDTRLSDTDKALISAATDTPTIDVYDDLSDLLIADPIHDVDEEAGWPKHPDDA